MAEQTVIPIEKLALIVLDKELQIQELHQEIGELKKTIGEKEQLIVAMEKSIKKI